MVAPTAMIAKKLASVAVWISVCELRKLLTVVPVASSTCEPASSDSATSSATMTSDQPELLGAQQRAHDRRNAGRPARDAAFAAGVMRESTVVIRPRGSFAGPARARRCRIRPRRRRAGRAAACGRGPTPAGVPVLITSPGQQGHELRHVADQRRHVEDHVGGGALLLDLAVDLEPEARRRERRAARRASTRNGPERREAVGALPLRPLPAPLQLEAALRVVVVQHEAGDVRQRVLDGDVLRARADHQRQLDLPVGLVAAARQDADRRSGPASALVAFRNTIGSLGQRGAALARRGRGS